MPNAAVQRYRLTIGAPNSGTLICIGATQDDDALSKAERIFEQIGGPHGEFRLQRANGALVFARSPTRSG